MEQTSKATKSLYLKRLFFQIVKKTLNASIPGAPWLTGYVAILIGAIITFLVQGRDSPNSYLDIIRILLPMSTDQCCL
jgi:hypothetical protein